MSNPFKIIVNHLYMSQVPRDYDLPDDEAKRAQKQEQNRIDNATPLNEEEAKEKDDLLTQVATQEPFLYTVKVGYFQRSHSLSTKHSTCARPMSAFFLSCYLE